MGESDNDVSVVYHLCPQCYRATPAAAHETYCPNDGNVMLDHCPRCAAAITSPYGRFCSDCGRALGKGSTDRTEAASP